MYYPLEEEFIKLAQNPQWNMVPIVTEIANDEISPLTVFKTLQEQSAYAFLLESVEKGENLGRYTFIGINPMALIRYENGTLSIKENDELVVEATCRDPFVGMKDYMQRFRPYEFSHLAPFVGGAVGYVGYDVVRAVEDIPQTGVNDLQVPDMLFMVHDFVLVFDHLLRKLQLIVMPLLGDDRHSDVLKKCYADSVKRLNAFIDQFMQRFDVSGILRLDEFSVSLPEAESLSYFSKDEFMVAVKRCVEYIHAGDILQVVLSQRFSYETSAHPLEVYRCLRATNPSPYMFYLKCDDFVLAGSSPETMVKVHDGRVVTKPIAGTRKRGVDEAEDLKMAKDLLSDAKERAEHLMLVDLGRNDIGKISLKNSVQVKEFMQIERYSHVMHIVSLVEGALKEGIDAYDAIKACFPAGTLSGAPKVRAMEIIDELEPTKRGPYGGLAGYISFSGEMDTCITIRSMVFKQGHAYVQAGAGIVADSVPELEYQETVNKAMAVLSSVVRSEKRIS